jgi:hypothetical protein
MMRMKPLFRPLLDHHDRGISLVMRNTFSVEGVFLAESQYA